MVVWGDGCYLGVVVWGDGCCLRVVVWGDGCCLRVVVWGDGCCLGVVIWGDGWCLGVVVWQSDNCLGVVVCGDGCYLGVVVWGDGCCLGLVVWGDGCCLGLVVWGDNRYWCFLCIYLVEFPSPFLSSSTTNGWKCAGLRGNNKYINTFLPYVSNANSWRDGRISYKQTKLTLSCRMETRLTKEQKTRAPIHLSKQQNHWISSVSCLIHKGLQILSFSISRTKKG